METNAVAFDKIACEVFAPIYPVITGQIKHKTGITRGRCLDIGSCGGHLGIAMAGITGLNVVLFDKSPEALEIAGKRILDYNLQDRVKTLQGDVHRIPLNNKTMDLIISRGSVWFWEDCPKAFREIYRVLAPGGFAYIGGGFGTVELKNKIAAKMEQRDKEGKEKWRDRVKRNTGKEAVERFEQIMRQTKIPEYEIINEEAGMWIVFGRTG